MPILSVSDEDSMIINLAESWFFVTIGCKFLCFTFHLELVELDNIFKKRCCSLKFLNIFFKTFLNKKDRINKINSCP